MVYLIAEQDLLTTAATDLETAGTTLAVTRLIGAASGRAHEAVGRGR